MEKRPNAECPVQYSKRMSSAKAIETVSVDSVNAKSFQKHYVLKRKPCVIQGLVKGFDLDLFQLENLADFLEYDDFLQVERKHRGGYGSGENRVNLKLADFLDKLKNGDHSLYLTTQYEDDHVDDASDDSASVESGPGADFESDSEIGSIDLDNLHDDFELTDDEADNDDEFAAAHARVQELLQKPLTNLYRKWSMDLIRPELLEILVPQQINLWMGRSDPDSRLLFNAKEPNLGLGRSLPSPGASSSGLHHDHADNLYIPISGRKRFTLFPPSDAPNLYMVGDIQTIYPSGIIDYVRNKNAPFWKHVRGDGALVEQIALWQLETLDLDEAQKKRLESVVEQESVVQAEKATSGTSKKDPPSFSRIPPALLHLDEVEDPETRQQMQKLLDESFPLLKNCTPVEVIVQPGMMLYLPAGWLHEVSSFGTGSDLVHTAVNYWFAPPDQASWSVYSDDYWTRDFDETGKCLRVLHSRSR